MRRKATEFVRVRDIDPSVLQPPFSFSLARAVTGPYRPNGAKYIGVHLAPHDVRDFFPTAIVDETTPDKADHEGKLMVQGGTQYGCSARTCSFCVFTPLCYHRDLERDEIVDLFRAPLYLHSKGHEHVEDNRRLVLKFTDNGEPLESPVLLQAMDKVVELFGKPKKTLLLKVSTVLSNKEVTRETFRKLLEWQKRNRDKASVHLQISRVIPDKKLISPHEVADIVRQWVDANPHDQICIAPGLVKGYDEKEFREFCEALKPVARHCFFRLSVIKPSTRRQEENVLDEKHMAAVNERIKKMGFKVKSLAADSVYGEQLRGAGTLSHTPAGRVYDPTTYIIWEYDRNKRDPNTPITSQ